MAGEHNSVALVTGAASGIGAAIAAELARRGWRVGGLDLNHGDTTLSVLADVSDRSAVHAGVEEVVQVLGHPSLLVTAAGFYEMAPTLEIDDERWSRMLAVHLGGAVNACWAVLPGMIERGSGTVVTISSELALAGGDNDVHYVAAKGAIVGFTRSLGVELAPHGIRINSVAPGPTDTPLLAADSPWRAPGYLAGLPLRRLVTPEEVAQTVLFLVEEGTYFAGQTISPNAGAVI